VFVGVLHAGPLPPHVGVAVAVCVEVGDGVEVAVAVAVGVGYFWVAFPVSFTIGYLPPLVALLTTTIVAS
jgi:hypothetical protein